jgi:hypothetical protein
MRTDAGVKAILILASEIRETVMLILMKDIYELSC